MNLHFLLLGVGSLRCTKMFVGFWCMFTLWLLKIHCNLSDRPTTLGMLIMGPLALLVPLELSVGCLVFFLGTDMAHLG